MNSITVLQYSGVRANLRDDIRLQCGLSLEAKESIQHTKGQRCAFRPESTQLRAGSLLTKLAMQVAGFVFGIHIYSVLVFVVKNAEYM